MKKRLSRCYQITLNSSIIMLFGVFLIFVWTARFIVEFVKVGQTERDGLWLLTTGQILSIPLITVGVYLTWKALKNNSNV
jgi:prolipoprotein diacylglyceryltransferase